MPSVKVYGPYKHRGQYRCYIKSAAGTRAWCPCGRTREEALAHAADTVEGFQSRYAVTVGGLVERYLEHLELNDRKPVTVDAARVKLDLILEPLLGAEIAAVTAHRARQRYAELARTCAAASHHVALGRARSAWAWAVREGMARINPWTDVRPIGRQRRGKPQLTTDETRRLADRCLEDVLTDDRALAVLLLIFCGVRSSEVLRRQVRDVDAGGTVLLIPEAKTERGVRAPAIPDVIQPAVQLRVIGRHANALLFADKLGGMRPRGWLERAVKTYCRLAEVPLVCTHSLRGGWASITYDAGALSHVVAAALGHGSDRVTKAHYATPAAVAASEQARRLRALRGPAN